MFSFSNKPFLRLPLFVLLALSLAAFTASAAPQTRAAQTVDVSDIVTHPDQYMGKEVTVDWKVDKVYSPTTIGLEKDEHHLLVIAVNPAALQANMKEGDPFKVSGRVRNFDRAAFEREYGALDFGKAPLHSFDNKPVLVVGARKTANLEQPQAIGREKPSTTEPEAAAPAAPTEQTTPSNLPRTASPLPAIGLAGLLALILGLGMPLLRRQ